MSSSTLDDKILQSKINDEYIQYATTNIEISRTNLCWDIKEFGSISNSEMDDEGKLQFHKTVTLTKHSCTCDLNLVFEPYKDEFGQNKCKSLLKMKLYACSCKGDRLFVSVIFRNDRSKSPLFTSIKKSWNLTSSEEKNLEFLLPSINKRYSSSYEKYNLNGLVKENNLTIHILFEEALEVEHIENESLDSGKETQLDLRVLAELYEKKLLVDVIFKLPDQKLLHAHSNVLAVACPYFLSMFTTSEMKEQKTRIVDLSADEDVSFEIFKGFLDYVYGVKRLNEMKSIMRGLAILADKYGCSKLRKECESILCNTLDRSNVVHNLLFSHQYNFSSLKRKALHFAKTHGMDTSKNRDGFDEVCKNSELLSELIPFFSAK